MGSIGTWFVFAGNRVDKRKELTDVNWKYVPTEHNLSDLGNIGAQTSKIGECRLRDPYWLKNHDDWPEQPETVEVPEILCEKVTTKLFASNGNDVLHSEILVWIEFVQQQGSLEKSLLKEVEEDGIRHGNRRI